MIAYSLQSVREQPEAIRQIVLMDQGLKLVPPEIRACRSVQTLDLRGNALTELPDWLRELTYLKNLRLDRNALTRMPAVLADLPNLRMASLSENQISRLSKKLKLPAILRTLDLRHNRIGTWPSGILDQVELEKLDLSYNPLGAFPDCGTATSFLQYLHLSQTRLKSMPQNLGAFQQLRQLYLDRNQLTDSHLPGTWPPKLELLDLSHNQLLRLPAKLSQAGFLRKLHLDYNQLRELRLPDDLRWLSELTVSHNQLLKVRAGNKQGGALAVLDVRENTDLASLQITGTKLRTLQIDGCDFRKLLPLPNSLHILSARRNRRLTADTIIGGDQLEHLDLGYTALDTPDWPILPKLQVLGIQHTPLSRRHPLPDQLIRQTQLTDLTGYRHPDERRCLLAALDLRRKYGLAENTARSVWQALRDPDRAGSSHTLEQMLPWLTWNLVELWPPALLKLRDQYEKLPDRELLAEIGVQFMGTFPDRDRRIRAGTLEQIPQSDRGVWVLGNPPFTVPLHLPENGVIDEATFWQWLEKDQSIPALDQHRAEQICRLLWSSPATNQQLALHVLRGLNVPEPLWPALIIQWKRTESDKIRRQIRAILQSSLPGDAQIILNRPLSFQRTSGVSAFRQKIKQLTRGSGLDMEEALDLWESIIGSGSTDQGPW